MIIPGVHSRTSRHRRAPATPPPRPPRIEDMTWQQAYLHVSAQYANLSARVNILYYTTVSAWVTALIAIVSVVARRHG